MSDEAIAKLQASLHGLVLDAEGIAPRCNELEQLNRIAALARTVITLTRSPQTPQDLLAHRLAKLTEDLLTTALQHGSPQLVKAWILARAELVEHQAATREAANPRRESD